MQGQRFAPCERLDPAATVALRAWISRIVAKTR
jgi:hypothetical protein